MLIVDGYASYITIKVIKFYLAYKIILLCLLPHTTYMLQLLDVRLFVLLASLYKKGIQERLRFLINYSINKVDFLKIYRLACKEAF